MKEKIKKYLNGVWGIEILILVIFSFLLITGYYQAFNDYFSKLGAGTFDALLHRDKYIESMIYYESRHLSKYIYTNTKNLEYIEPIKYENENLEEENYYNGDIDYVLINKKTGDFTTNDRNLYDFIEDYDNNIVLLEDNINIYLKEQGLSSVRLDNNEKYNYYISTMEDKINTQNIDQYIEIYYKDPATYNYVLKTDLLTAEVMIASTILLSILFIKIVFNFIFNRNNINLEIKAIKRLIFVLRYGYKYKNTRNKIIISFSGAIVVILIYLYLVAGIRNQNLLVTFLTRYPFKGT